MPNQNPNNRPITVKKWGITLGIPELLAVVGRRQKTYSQPRFGVEPRKCLSGTPFEAVIHTLKKKKEVGKNYFIHQYTVNNFGRESSRPAMVLGIC